MKRKLFWSIISVLFLGSIYFFLKPAASFRTKLWHSLDKDILYLNDGRIIRGWIWERRDNLITGYTEEDEVFVLKSSEPIGVKENELLRYLQELI